MPELHTVRPQRPAVLTTWMQTVALLCTHCTWAVAGTADNDVALLLVIESLYDCVDFTKFLPRSKSGIRLGFFNRIFFIFIIVVVLFHSLSDIKLMYFRAKRGREEENNPEIFKKSCGIVVMDVFIVFRLQL